MEPGILQNLIRAYRYLCNWVEEWGQPVDIGLSVRVKEDDDIRLTIRGMGGD